jgi:hypothetical protein
MTSVDDILKLIGLTTVLIVVAGMLIGISFYAYGFIAGIAHGMEQESVSQDTIASAMNNYNYNLELVKEQTQRLDMYYAAKTSTEMSQTEFQSWLGMIRGLTDEFVLRENNAITSGKGYMSYLSKGGDEYNRVYRNEITCEDDIKKVKYTYNGNVYIYNQKYGDTNSTIPYMD